MMVAPAQRELADLVRLTQWLSPAFPLGAFAYSHGLETVIARGEITDADGLEHWLDDILTAGSGRSDALILSLVHREILPDGELASLAAALAPSRERWDETLAQGSAFVSTTNALLGTDIAPAALPVVVGIQARSLELATEVVIALYLHGFAGNLVAVATRAVPLGQTAGQGVLDRLAPRITALARTLADATLEDFASAVPRADIAAMAHEIAEVRLFRS
ncbi:MAG: urease accessory protein UreF [Rhodobacteraceae bacterium]|nr:urease accessory protein UreF [Paracoccaceae bacterium]